MINPTEIYNRYDTSERFIEYIANDPVIPLTIKWFIHNSKQMK